MLATCWTMNARSMRADMDRHDDAIRKQVMGKLNRVKRLHRIYIADGLPCDIHPCLDHERKRGNARESTDSTRNQTQQQACWIVSTEHGRSSMGRAHRSSRSRRHQEPPRMCAFHKAAAVKLRGPVLNLGLLRLLSAIRGTQNGKVVQYRFGPAQGSKLSE